MIVERLLRAAAVAIALLGVVDPALTLPWRERPIVGVVVVRPSARESSEVGREALSADAARALRDRVVAALRTEFDARGGETTPADAAAVVLVGDGRSPVDVSLPAGTVVSAVVPAPLASAVRITHVDAPRRAPISGRVPITVQLDARGFAGRTSTLVVRADGLELARKTHTWRDAAERASLTLDAIPLHVGLTRFSVAVLDDGNTGSAAAATRAPDTGAASATRADDTRPAGSTTSAAGSGGTTRGDDARSAAAATAGPASDAGATRDAVVRSASARSAGAMETAAVLSSADMAVEVHDRPLRVLFVSARPSWATQFIRRALDNDPRFAVVSATRVSRGVTATTAGAPVTLQAADPDDFHAIVVGAPEALTQAEVEILRTFARVRGGVVIVAPDRRPEGPVLDLLPARDFNERLLSDPVALLPSSTRTPANPPATAARRQGPSNEAAPASATAAASAPARSPGTLDADARLWATELAVARVVLPGTETLLHLASHANDGRVDDRSDAADAVRAAPAPAAALSSRGSAAATAASSSPAPASASAAIVMQSPLGEGAVIVSGALDAWRYRDRAAAAFDRFWRETIAARAQAVPDPVEVTLEPAIARPGDRVDVAVRVRTAPRHPTTAGGASVNSVATAAITSATREASDGTTGPAAIGATPIRLWPDSRPGAYHGVLNAPSQDGVYAVSVQLDGAVTAIGRAALWVDDDIQVARPAWAGLQAFVDARHGSLVTADRMDRLAPALRDALRSRQIDARARPARRPLRSAWWILPFAACLGGEWLLRRRRGAR